jgi:hypothetical protein
VWFRQARMWFQHARVWFQYAQNWFLHADNDFHTQSVTLHSECDFTLRVWFPLTRENFWHVCVWIWHSFIHAECNFHTQSDFDTHECDKDTHNCDFNMHKSDFYTQSVILTRISVNSTRTSVISTRTSLTSASRVRYPHAECGLHSKFKIRWWFKLLSRICRTTFFKIKSQCIRKWKNLFFFFDVTKVENSDKKCLTLSKKNQKSILNIFALINQNRLWKSSI